MFALQPRLAVAGSVRRGFWGIQSQLAELRRLSSVEAATAYRVACVTKKCSGGTAQYVAVAGAAAVIHAASYRMWRAWPNLWALLRLDGRNI